MLLLNVEWKTDGAYVRRDFDEPVKCLLVTGMSLKAALSEIKRFEDLYESEMFDNHGIQQTLKYKVTGIQHFPDDLPDEELLSSMGLALLETMCERFVA